MILKYILEKEFRQIRRNPIFPKLILIFPCMMMLLMPWATTLEVKNSRVCVIDQDHSSLSRQIASQIDATDFFTRIIYLDNYEEAINQVNRGDADIILEIPGKMERKLMRGEEIKIQISANAINGTKGMLGSAYLVEILNKELLKARGLDMKLAEIKIVENYLFNPKLDYKTYMVPALMVMLLTMLCGFLPALNIVSEKEVGTIEQINVTPLNKFVFILGKLLPYWVIGLIVLSICFVLAHLLYGLTSVGSLVMLYFFACIYILVMSGAGLVISNYSATMQQAMFVTFFFMLICILLSGLFTPVSSMPVWARFIAQINPLTHFNEVMRMIFLKGSGLCELLPQLLILLSFMLFFNVWAIFSYHKTK